MGDLGDVFAERRVFTIGVLGFGGSSIVCALAPSIEVLVAGRVLQGVFGALLTPCVLAVIVTAFPPEQRGAAVGSWLAWSGLAAVVGPRSRLSTVEVRVDPDVLLHGERGHQPVKEGRLPRTIKVKRA